MTTAATTAGELELAGWRRPGRAWSGCADTTLAMPACRVAALEDERNRIRAVSIEGPGGGRGGAG